MEEMPFEFNVKSRIEISVLVSDCESTLEQIESIFKLSTTNTNKIKFIHVQEISYFNWIS